MVDLNARYKFGCETDTNWIARRLNFERKGSRVECLQKGYGYGESHTFRGKDSELQDFTPTEQANLKVWGADEGPVNTDYIFGNHDEHGTWPPNVVMDDEKSDTVLHLASVLPDFAYVLTFAPTVSYDVWTALEEFQPAQKSNGVQCSLFSHARAPSVDRYEPKTIFQAREYLFLHDSFSLAKTQSVFDAEDLQAMFGIAFAAKGGRLLFVLPALTKTLTVLAHNIVLCEVDFVSGPPNNITFYFNSRLKEELSLEWYSTIMMQQFALPGTAWNLQTFEVGDDITLVLIALLRMFDHVVDKRTLRRVTEKPNRVRNFIYAMQKTHIIHQKRA